MSPPEAPRKSEPAPREAVALYNVADFQIDESIGYLLKRVRSILTNAVAREIADEHVTFEQWGVLLAILHERGETAAILSRGLECDTGSMTRMLDRLEAKHMIRRTRSTDDRRRVRLELTAEGKRMAEELKVAMVTVLNRHLHGFSADELELFKGFLRRVIANRSDA